MQLVFISSDSTAEDAQQHYEHQQGGWVALAWDDPLAASLKRRHRVWSGREVGTFGYDRRAGVPSIVVIDPKGAELAFLPTERFGSAALKEWDPQAQQQHVWPTNVKSEL